MIRMERVLGLWIILTLSISVCANAQNCNPVWSALGLGVDQRVEDFVMFDDGNGEALYVCGFFSNAGGQPSDRIAKWDGLSWSSLNVDFSGSPQALAVFDDGNGPALFVAGSFSAVDGQPISSIVKWDGASWSGIGNISGSVRTLIVHDDGSGPALYAGGNIGGAGGQIANGVAKWDGAVWSALGSGLGGQATILQALDMAVFDDGTGPALFVTGEFTTAGGAPAEYIAKWDGSSWSPVGGGLSLTGTSLAVFDDGTGPALYVGGFFGIAGGVSVSRIAKWDGNSWSAVGSGVNGGIQSLAVFDDGTGPVLYAAGHFTAAGGQPAEYIASWDGSSWSAPLPGLDSTVFSLGAFEDGRGPVLYVGGLFTSAGGAPASNIAEYRRPLGEWSNIANGANDAVRLFQKADLGAGEQLFVGGDFSVIFGQSIRAIASFDGSQLSALGAGIGGPGSSVHSMVLHDDGSGLALYVGGTFTESNGGPGNFVARWDGSQWSALGAGTNNTVLTLASVDHGDGPVLYAGGLFTQAGGQAANRIARWNGSSWETVAGGACSNVRAMAVIGPNLIVGGDFTHVGGNGCFGGINANHIARFNGAAWSALGLGTNGAVHSLLVRTNDDGSALLVGGQFDTAGTVVANRVARWNGSNWFRVGAGFDNGIVHSLTLLDLGTDFGTGTTPTPVALGSFTTSEGRTVNQIARWDGQRWREFRQGVSANVGVSPGSTALAASDYGDPGRMIVGGFFTQAGGTNANRIARWSACLPPSTACLADFNADGVLNFFDIASFITLFLAQDTSTDLTADGLYNFFDVSAYIQLFNAGCP